MVGGGSLSLRVSPRLVGGLSLLLRVSPRVVGGLFLSLAVFWGWVMMPADLPPSLNNHQTRTVPRARMRGAQAKACNSAVSVCTQGSHHVLNSFPVCSSTTLFTPCSLTCISIVNTDGYIYTQRAQRICILRFRSEREVWPYL